MSGAACKGLVVQLVEDGRVRAGRLILDRSGGAGPVPTELGHNLVKVRAGDIRSVACLGYCGWRGLIATRPDSWLTEDGSGDGGHGGVCASGGSVPA